MSSSRALAGPSVPTAANKWIWVAVACWLAALAVGFGALWRYKAAAAAQDGSPPRTWPGASRLQRATDRATLVLFAHPRCACTQASVSELARLMARLHDRVAVRVSVVRPAGTSAGFEDTELLARASAIPGATVTVDEGGVEAERFHARTSGHVVVYDASGRRLFSGGITSARGHEGESFGGKRIASLLTTGVADRDDAPVFGCALGAPGGQMEESSR